MLFFYYSCSSLLVQWAVFILNDLMHIQFMPKIKVVLHLSGDIFIIMVAKAFRTLLVISLEINWKVFSFHLFFYSDHKEWNNWFHSYNFGQYIMNLWCLMIEGLLNWTARLSIQDLIIVMKDWAEPYINFGRTKYKDLVHIMCHKVSKRLSSGLEFRDVHLLDWLLTKSPVCPTI